MKSTVEAVMAGVLPEDAAERSYALHLASDLLRTQDAEPLKRFLFNALQQEINPHRTSELIWVLGKSCDAQFVESYRDFLRKFVDNMPQASADLYQTLIALDNCGEPVFEYDANRRSHQSILNVEANLRQAKAYLAKLKHSRPHQEVRNA